jgi:conjugative relaxase-like TrwC/TraI family protein
MMRVTVLKAPKAGGVSAIVRYLAPGTPERTGPGGYYTESPDPPGRWWGTGCDAVGLAGDVDPEQLERMLQAEHPHDGRRLGRGFGEPSARAYDATFSAPKSVSLLWALSPDEDVRTEVVAAHDAAVEVTLGWLEEHGCVTRRGKDGVHQVDARGLTVALFRQHTSRMLDPQLHTHAVIWSKVQDPTGAWLALDARFLLKQQYTMSWLYDAALRVELTQRLGLDWEPLAPGQGQADLTAVPEALRDLFSQRSVQVEAKLAELVRRWMAEHDGVEPSVEDLWQLTRRAAVTSRPGKSAEPIDLRDDWLERAEAAGFDVERLAIDEPRPRLADPGDRDTVITTALERVAEQGSSWIEADLAREIAGQLSPDSVEDAGELFAIVDDLAAEAAGRCVELHPPAEAGVPVRRNRRPITEHVTSRALTTDAVLAQEARLLGWADTAIDPAPEVDADDRQRAVADAIAGTGRLVLVVGPAGAGKTTAVAAGVEQLRQQRRNVVGLAPSGKAADVLADATGAPAATLAKLLHADRTGRQLPPRGTTLILDEAGMASTEDLDHLVALCQRWDWRLVAVGDPEQLPSVTRGGMFAHWTDILPAHRLEHIHRFDEPWQADASLALRRGDPAAAVTYAEHERVRSVHPAVVAQQVARTHAAVTARGETLAITTSSQAMARAINEEIQWLARSGKSERQTRPLTVRLADGTEAGAGDRVATRRNVSLETDRGVTVRNRHTWTVTAVTADGSVRVSDPDRGSVTLPTGYVAEAVELGWAVTGYGNQGITADHAICVIEPGSSRAGIYVGLTRGRGHNSALVVDPTGTADPTDALARAIARPANASTAHALRDRLYREHGLEPPGRHVGVGERRVEPGLAGEGLLRARLEALQRPAPARVAGR